MTNSDSESKDFIDPGHRFAQAIRAVALNQIKEILGSVPSLVHARVRGSVGFDGTVWQNGERVAADPDDSRSTSAIGFAAFHGHAE